MISHSNDSEKNGWKRDYVWADEGRKFLLSCSRCSFVLQKHTALSLCVSGDGRMQFNVWSMKKRSHFCPRMTRRRGEKEAWINSWWFDRQRVKGRAANRIIKFIPTFIRTYRYLHVHCNSAWCMTWNKKTLIGSIDENFEHLFEFECARFINEYQSDQQPPIGNICTRAGKEEDYFPGCKIITQEWKSLVRESEHLLSRASLTHIASITSRSFKNGRLKWIDFYNEPRSINKVSPRM